MRDSYIRRRARGSDVHLVMVKVDDGRAYKVVIVVGGALQVEAYVTPEDARDFSDLLRGDVSRASRPGVEAAAPPRPVAPGDPRDITDVGTPGARTRTGRAPRPVPPDDDGDF